MNVRTYMPFLSLMEGRTHLLSAAGSLRTKLSATGAQAGCLRELLIPLSLQEREQSVSEKSSIGFEIDGLGYRGDRIFVMAVDEDSLARERGVRVGDEVRWKGGRGTGDGG